MEPFVFLIWFPLALLAFALAPRPYAVWVCLIGGWVILPPAIYAEVSLPGFPFWIIGGSLPSDVLMNKAWIVPVATCAASLSLDSRRWRHASLHPWDIPLAAFCLWPIMQHALSGYASPSGWLASLYLAGTWALPWWLGRLYLRTSEDIQRFAAVLTGMMLVLLPIAIVEAVSEVRVHSVLFGEHPFSTDGVRRYVGYRPQALFEHGNQYGLWCAAGTIAAFWLWQQKHFKFAAAGILALMTFASQSVGAIGLMMLGILALTWKSSFSLACRYGIWPFSAAIVGAGLLITGLLPVRALIDSTEAGQLLLDTIRSTGRGSFAWRVSQDLKAAPLIRENFLLGHGEWNWFYSAGSRPWGFPLLVVGQFGLIGLTLLLVGLTRAVWSAIRRAAIGNEAAKLASVLMVVAGLDAVLNSFLFWPTIILAGYCPTLKRSENELDLKYIPKTNGI